MCTEPESMIPITTHHARNIVLIGDHKQLQPIILEEKAKHLGLQTSLFERYSEKSSMLETQYRMHTGIMEFPSDMFYDGKLKCGSEKQQEPVKLDIWPNGKDHPMVFCHVEGTEDGLTVATEDGSEMSKFNQIEAEFVVNAAINLVNNYGVNKKDIVILSQYRAQCATIKRLFEEKKVKDMIVLTVMASQGSEWDFVIFSTVRSQPQDTIEEYPSKKWMRLNLGFTTNGHQINVALTRARWGHIIIGNKHLLGCGPFWNTLIKGYGNKSLVTDANSFHLTRHPQTRNTEIEEDENQPPKN
ncbi:hypothetical protein LOTGIDRAFT_209970 [Lottia gigantea]|uniref:DNA2/NAM7 helicase-like C-terminal domain-containing protein n=1 Tax=Lottia gigantea TaxID=225164 RepID=V3ZD41_LOTGI|nr:hypothetical protein LOTGIDRAFT_209970 [Lottia gigantea]ESO89023.1 hypothetical protein LOTGIDRAFT_209970 [Lottia gigantea]